MRPSRNSGPTEPVLVYDRTSGTLVEEPVFNRTAMDFLHGTRLGMVLENTCVSSPLLSRLFGAYQRSGRSLRGLRRFIEVYDIPLDELDRPLEDFKSLDDFFTRTLAEGRRPIAAAPETLIAPADSRLLAYKIERGQVVPVKGRPIELEALLPSQVVSEHYYGGELLVFRLAPCDYHRFCYLDDGAHGPLERRGEVLHSVHPLALASWVPAFRDNVRDLCLLHSEHFGDVVHIDVGAAMVGRIVQHHPSGAVVHRGEEKGFFQFGGSTIILILQPGIAVLDEDIVSHSGEGFETLVRYGSAIGRGRGQGGRG
ncbi:MAG: hypothetical protein A2284_06075 [Deltaproteobacteria bacterium RIFOXYA12_FULL_61_11]|nr:MAG: hypothetical protein A2284_06075 [Deltaproteobacteria bacterium RIFOXYA12_FULL_61_11]